MSRRVVIFLVLVLVYPAWAGAQEAKVGALILTTPDQSQDSAFDMTLALAGAVASASGKKAVPYLQLIQALGYNGPQATGICSLDDVCSARVRQKMGLEILVIGQISRTDQGRIRIELRRTDRDPLYRFSRIREVADTEKDQIRNLMEMAREMVNPPSPLLVVHGSGTYQVEVDGALLGNGPGTFLVSAGRRKVRVLQGKKVVLEDEIPCPVGLRCEISIDKKPITTIRRVRRPQAPSEPIPWLRYGGYGTTAVGIVLLVVGSVEGLHVLSVSNELEDKCPQGLCSITWEEAQTLSKEGDQSAKNATVSLLAGTALTAGGIAMIVLDHMASKRAASPKKKAGLSPRFRFDPMRRQAQFEINF